MTKSTGLTGIRHKLCHGINLMIIQIKFLLSTEIKVPNNSNKYLWKNFKKTLQILLLAMSVSTHARILPDQTITIELAPVFD